MIEFFRSYTNQYFISSYISPANLSTCSHGFKSDGSAERSTCTVKVVISNSKSLIAWRKVGGSVVITNVWLVNNVMDVTNVMTAGECRWVTELS